MNNSKSTKRSLLMSALALVMCLSMFVGSTFAWFTDSVTSSNNIIKSGTLDVAMTYADEVDGTYEDASKGAIFDYKLWEPGYTQVKYVKLENLGTLALQYKLTVTPNVVNANEKVKLADVIDVYTALVEDGYTAPANFEAAKASMTKVGTLSDVLAATEGCDTGVLLPADGKGSDDVELPAGTEAYTGDVTVCIALHMQESAGNEYQNLSVRNGFSVQLLATQFTYENDAFNNLYDEGVSYEKSEELEYDMVYIYDLEDFTEFGKAVNGNKKFNGVNVANNNNVWVEVMADIDMTDAPAIQGTEFAIGNGNNLAFKGVFDGNNHTISNYSISAAWTYNVCLFRTTGGKFTMKDITFDNCSAAKTNNRNSSIIVGTIGDGTVTFDNVDIMNSTVTGVSGASAYVGNMNEGALYFVDCDVDNVTLTANNASGYNAMFLRDGYSHHDYEESGIWVENCTITNSKSVVNGTEESTVKEYNYTK